MKKHSYITIIAGSFVIVLTVFMVWRLKEGVKIVPGMSGGSSKIIFGSDTPDEEANTVESEASLVEGFPVVPVPEGLELRESSKRTTPMHTSRDFYARWLTKTASVIQLERWYEAEFAKLGWKVEPPDDKNAASEQIIHLSKDNLTGYVGIEVEGDEGVEVIIDFQQNK